ncbi:MAG: hypothetical protein WA738_21760 [Candidatus Angelobacter sp.]
MSAALTDRLYNLMPAVYRLRDSGQGEPLRALLALIQQEYDAVEQDIANLYENWFIETCSEWVVPYIGDLLDVRPIYAASPDTFSARAYVANTLDFRRRKGTATMLEQLAFDVTGWPARVVEFFQLLSTTQYLNHVRLGNLATADLRNADAMELIGGPFEKTSRTADVRHISNGRGKYNIPSIGIFLWRLQDYEIGPIPVSPADSTKDPAKDATIKTDLNGATRQGDARAVANPADGRYTFNPLGASAPLFNLPKTQQNVTQLADEINVPGPLRRRPLYEELEGLRQSEVDKAPKPTLVYFGDNPIFRIAIDGVFVPYDQIMICDTSDISATDWRRPAATKSYTPTAGGPPVTNNIRLAVDPVRGRIAFPAGAKLPSASLEVAYVYGFSADMGAGPYDRSNWLSSPTTGPAPFNSSNRWQVAVSLELKTVANTVFNTFTAAVKAWNKQVTGATPILDGVIAVLDSSTYQDDLNKTPITLPAGSRLLIVAADWAAQRQSPAGTSKTLDPNGLRPHFLGPISVNGSAPEGSPNPGQLFIDGLLIEGQVAIQAGNLGAFGLSHSTVTPSGGLTVQSAAGETNDALVVNLYRSICGPISFPTAPISPAQLNCVDSIISSGPTSANTDPALAAPGVTANISTSTVFGTINSFILSASDSLFTGVVTATRQQTGCVRFCFVPAGSQTGQRYHCQPDLALANVPNSARASILARVSPQFTSVDVGQPGYGQLSSACPVEITTGGDNESEMGAFNFLQQPQRATNLQTALDEYLRFGLEAGAILET